MKKKTAIYPGSFNPWHQGHDDVLRKAIQVFEKVIIARGDNPEKYVQGSIEKLRTEINCPYVEVVQFSGLLADFVKKVRPSAIIRGLRNSQDLEYEKTQQYWNEDLGIEIPTFYIICDRKLTHISSSAIKIIKEFKK